MSDIETSHLFGDRYEVVRKVGVGGMAEVFEARDTVLDRTVAVKVLLAKYAEDPSFLERFKNEARAAAGLASPYIVSIHDWGEDEGRCYIVMEYVRGTDLKKLVKRQGRMAPARVAEVAMQVCSALAEAHAHGVIHRDIKSSNIMLQQSGDVKIMDFGIAQAGGQDGSGSVMGTVHYMSPEQIRGRVPAPPSDLYSLGVVMYETATGSLPFKAENTMDVADKQLHEQPTPPRKLNPVLDQELEGIILKAMAKGERDRYASASEMRRALERYLSNPSHAKAERADGKDPEFWALGFLKAPARLQGKVAKVTQPVVLGRGKEADISIPDTSVSSQHVRLAPNGAYLSIEDLGSANGVKLNGIKIGQKAQCGPGDELVLGNVVIAIGCK